MARHFETLTRLYGALGHDPMGMREIPELMRYYHRLSRDQRDRWRMRESHPHANGYAQLHSRRYTWPVDDRGRLSRNPRIARCLH